jgi:NADH:ubiquinone oxidoreductase subunit 6 (subunit J)
MNFFDFLFYFVSGIIIISACTAVFSVRVETAFKAVMGTMAVITIIFFLLGTDYIAILYLLIFVLGTGSLLLFAFIKSGNLKISIEHGGTLNATIISAIFTALLFGSLIANKWKEIPADKPGLSVGEISGLIQSEYLLPLIITTIIIFVGLLGSSYLTRKN